MVPWFSVIPVIDSTYTWSFSHKFQDTAVGKLSTQRMFKHDSPSWVHSVRILPAWTWDQRIVYFLLPTDADYCHYHISLFLHFHNLHHHSALALSRLHYVIRECHHLLMDRSWPLACPPVGESSLVRDVPLSSYSEAQEPQAAPPSGGAGPSWCFGGLFLGCPHIWEDTDGSLV